MSAAGLFLSFTAFGAFLIRRRGSVPCGCSSDGKPVTGAVVARALALFAIAALGLAAGPQALNDVSLSECVVAVTSISSFAVLVWTLPAALGQPRPRQEQIGEATVLRLPRA